MRLGNSTRIDIRMKTDDSFEIPWVTGIEFLPDGRLLVSNTGNYRVLILGSDFKVEDNLSFSKDFVSVWDVAVVNETTAIVTLPFTHQIMFMQVVPRLQAIKVVGVGGKYYGVDLYNDVIYLACHVGRIRLFDREGNLQSVLAERFGGPYFIKVSHSSGNIFISDWNTGSLTRLSPAGKVIYRYDPSSLKRPLGLFLDNEDNAIVCDWRTDHVLVINARGWTHRNLLSSSDCMQSPYTVAYRRSDQTLVIGLQWTEWIHIVKLT